MRPVYSALKSFAFPDRLEALARGRLAAPVHVRIKPINACNHGCWYCAYRTDRLHLGSSMSLKDRLPEAKMAELCRDLIAMRVKAATFSGGGEPLLYPGLADAVRALARGGVQVAALTNGSLLKDAVAEAFAVHGTWIRVSIDAWDGESYAHSRGVSTAEFDKVLRNMAAFAALGSRCRLGVSFIVGRANASHIAQFCHLAKQAGVGSVKLSACVTANTGRENNAYHEPIAAIVSEQLGLARTFEDANFEIVDHYHRMDERFAKDYKTCSFARLLTVIGADQRVYACQDKAYTEEGVLGSIRERSFKEFWFSDENRRKLAEIDPSVQCGHHCVSHAKNRLLCDFLAVDPRHAAFV